MNSLNFLRSLSLISSDLYLTTTQAVTDSAKSSLEFVLAYSEAYFFLSNFLAFAHFDG